MSKSTQPQLLTSDLFGTWQGQEKQGKDKGKGKMEKGKPAPLGGNAAVSSADAELLKFSLMSAPEFSPVPAHAPMGVEALPNAGVVTRQKANDLAREIVAAEGKLTPKALEALRAWSGEGGLGGSTSAFYTPARLVDVIWRVATGLTTGQRVLEFACGSGAFLNAAPTGSLLTGVELDPTTAKIAQKLFPHATIHNVAFEAYHTQSADKPFDLVIGNPPFGPRGESAIIDRPQLKIAHWYFTLAGLERLTPGGIACLVVPEDMVRNVTERPLRERLLCQAHLLGVHAIPQSAFGKSGAGVQTALLILRRHDAGVAEALGALTDSERQKFLAHYLDQEGQHFLEGTAIFKQAKDGSWEHRGTFTHLGEAQQSYPFKVGTGRFNDPVLDIPTDFSDQRVEQVVSTATERARTMLTRLQVLSAVATLFNQEARDRVEATRAQPHPIAHGTLSKCGSYRFQHGQWVYRTALNNPAVLSALDVARKVVAARKLRTQASHQAAIQAHDTHLSTFGEYDLTAIEKGSRQLPLLSVITECRGQVPEILSQVGQQNPALTGQTISEVARELEMYGMLGVDTLMQHAGVSWDAAQSHLLAEYAFNGLNWESRTTYFQGHALHKARRAEELAVEHDGLERYALEKQAEALRLLAPYTDVADMHLDPRDPLIPAHVVEAWVNVQLQSHVKIKRNAWDTGGEEVNAVLVNRGEHGLSLSLRNNFEYAWNLSVRQQVDQAAIRRMEAYLNYRTPVDNVANQDLKSEEQINAERNANQQKAVAYERELAKHFRNWVLESDFAQTVQEVLNEGRYAILPYTMDSAPLHLTAYRGPLAHPFQAGHVRSLARKSGGILNFDVGLGKTLTAMMLAALLRQAGRAQLPAIVVELSRLGDFVMNAAIALPDYNVLVIGGNPARNPDGSFLLNGDGEPVIREDSGVERRQKIGKLIAGTPDLVIFTYEAFEMIPMLAETRSRMIMTDPSAMTALRLSSTFDERGRKMTGHRELVDIEKYRQRHLGRVKVATQNDIPFEALGIDAVIVDEAHNLKNLWAAPSVYGEANPKFLGGQAESNRALDAAHKFGLVRERGGLTVGMTATWFNNSPVEIYNMLRLFTDDLPKYGVTDIASFISQFVVIEPRLVTQPSGHVEYVACVVGFRNLDVLRGSISQYVIKEDEDSCLMADGVVGMKLPDLDTVEHVFDLPDEVQAIYDANQLDVGAAESQGEKHLFAIFNRLAQLTLHPPLQKVPAANVRFDTCVQQCLEARKQGGRNLIFMYMGGPEQMTYEALRSRLVAAGYPAGEIGIVTGHTCPTTSERLKIERRFRKGELSLLIGSQIMEKGANLQGATDLHHMDYPHHYPAFKQRIGRGRRQGSTVERIRNHLYFARGSFDVLRYQGMLGKRGWSEQLYDPSVITCENTNLGFNGEEIAIMLARDPQAMRSLIAQRKAERLEDAVRATFRADLEVVREYLTHLTLLTSRDRQARARKEGPSRIDLIGITRLVTKVRELRRAVTALADAGKPVAALARLSLPINWQAGLPLHKGMTFQIGTHAYTVLDPTFSSTSLKAASADGSFAYLKFTELTEVKEVKPTSDDEAFGKDALYRLRPALVSDVLSGSVTPEPAATPAVASAPSFAPPASTQAPAAPANLRFGVHVTRTTPRGFNGSAYAMQGDQLTPVGPSDLSKGKLLLIERRPNGEVRQVTVVLPEESAYSRTRELLLKGDSRLRDRLRILLAQAA